MAEDISSAMELRAAEIDDLRSWDKAEYEEAWRGVEAWIDKNRVRIDALDEVRGYIDNIMEAKLGAIQGVEFKPNTEESQSPLDYAQVQADGFTSMINIGLMSSLLVAEHIKSKFRK